MSRKTGNPVAAQARSEAFPLVAFNLISASEPIVAWIYHAIISLMHIPVPHNSVPAEGDGKAPFRTVKYPLFQFSINKQTKDA